MDTQHPPILTRYLASTIDGIVILLLSFVSAIFFQGDDGFNQSLRIGIIAFMFLAYEPLFTSLACTLGQRIIGIRVRDLDTLKRISIFRAFPRYIVKVFIGAISLFTVPFADKKDSTS